jgi:hypothetical protein
MSANPIRSFAPSLALLFVSTGALAQPRDPVAAEALYKEGRDLVARGDWTAACPKFDASMALDPAASTLLNIAQCHDKAGRLARAWAEYRRAVVLNQETPGAERRKVLEDIANKGIAALEPRLPKLRIVVRDAPAGLRITRDGQEVASATLGQALPADPGEHEVVATAPSHRPEKRRVSLVEGKTTDLELVLVRGDEAAAPDPGGTAGPTPAAPADRASEPSGGVPTWAWIAGGVGIALVGAAVAFRLDGAAAESELDDECGTERVCDPSSGYDPDEANARKNRDFGLFIGLGAAGVVGIGVAIIGIVTAPSSKSPSASLPGKIGIGASHRGTGLSVTGAF